MRTRSFCLFVLLAAAGACGSDVDDRPVSFAYIYEAIIVPNCTTSGCHSALSHVGNAGNLSDKNNAFDSLRGFLTVNLLEGVQKLSTDNTMYEYRMPPDQPLPQRDIDLIGKWLLTCAEDTGCAP